MDSNNNPISVNAPTLDIDVQESQSDEPSLKKAKPSTSDCWKFFTRMGIGKDGIERARCNACMKEYKVGGKLYGTSSLNGHIPKCKQIKFDDVGQMMVDMQGKLKSPKIDQLVSRELCAAAIIEHDFPFNFVEYKKIRNWMKYLNPNVIPISRNTAKADVMNIHNKEKEKLKQTMTDIPDRICLTSDLWTSCTIEGYICLTAHFVDHNWKLNSKILIFCHMPPPHTGFELATKILDFLKELEIENKIFSITLDNASANDNMQENLKNNLALQNSLLCDGEFFHVRCCAHILNLIVQEGLKVASDALHKIRESVKYVRGSKDRMLKFNECIAQSGVESSVGLRLDVPTRWNSTYLMLETAFKYQRAFATFQLKDNKYKYCPSIDEWRRGEKIYEFLLPFFDTTNLISGQSYPTVNLYFLQVWGIQCVLQDSLSSEDYVIRSMGEMMMVKFKKYWDQYSIVLAFGAVLDPRMKFTSLSFCYDKLDPHTCAEKVEYVRGKLYKLFEKYASMSSSSTTNVRSSAPPPTSSLSKASSSHRMFGELKLHNHQLATRTGKSQLDIYLDEPNLDIDYYEDMDVLQWWKDTSNHFPDLSVMARDLLSIPITTVASESAFSIGSSVLNKYRSRLLPRNVQALICTPNWLCGFLTNDEDVDDADGSCSRGESSSSKGASNVVNMEDE